MSGDGINDSSALARADVGMAMRTGTDLAMESASVNLAHGDLRAIVRARRLSRVIMRNVRQNLFFAFAYNALGVPIAAGVLHPFTGLLLNPMIAAAAMNLRSVIGNAVSCEEPRSDPLAVPRARRPHTGSAVSSDEDGRPRLLLGTYPRKFFTKNDVRQSTYLWHA